MVWSGLTVPELLGLGIATGIATRMALSGAVWAFSMFRELAMEIMR